MKRVINNLFAHALPPLITFLLVCAVWQLAVTVFQTPAYLLPGPGRVLQSAIDDFEKLSQAAWISGAAAICGFGLSLTIGICVALLFAQSRVIRRAGFPYAIFLQTVPIVAIAPLVITWFGTGFRSVVVVSLVIGLFPIITNMTTGLISIDAGLSDLFRLNRATRLQTLLKLQLPNAIPHLVTGAKTSSGLAVVGAIVGEFFAGYGSGKVGLGYLILHAGPNLKTDELFATVIASTLLGVIIFSTVSLIGSTLLWRWTSTVEDS